MDRDSSRIGLPKPPATTGGFGFALTVGTAASNRSADPTAGAGLRLITRGCQRTCMEPSIAYDAFLAALVFGFLAFQDRLVSVLAGVSDRPHEELLEEP